MYVYKKSWFSIFLFAVGIKKEQLQLKNPRYILYCHIAFLKRPIKTATGHRRVVNDRLIGEQFYLKRKSTNCFISTGFNHPL